MTNDKPQSRVWTWEELAETQDLNHGDLFVSHSAFQDVTAERDDIAKRHNNMFHEFMLLKVGNDHLYSEIERYKKMDWVNTERECEVIERYRQALEYAKWYLRDFADAQENIQALLEGSEK